MQTDTPHPTFSHPPRILDVRQTLQPTPATMQDITCANIPPLSFLLLADRLGELYEAIFPDHPEWLDEEVASWSDEEAAADAVGRFLSRINVLFPVHDDIWDIDLEVIEWRLYEIPVMPFGYDCWYDDWDNFTEPVPYLLRMSHSRGNEDSPFMRDEFADVYPDHLVSRYLEPHRLVDTLRQIEMPYPELAALPDLILMLDHNTGNVWLDVGECALADGGGYPIWSAENVAWLTEEWQKARPTLDRIMSLLNWRNDSPEAAAEKVTAVRDVLLEAYERTCHPRMEQDEPTNTAIPATPA
ncbi:MAG: hypothetical protein HF973_06245 [Chloroflexi bacterium]|nr:hypothetical protein [Chloroflexota bacterium]